ncbi:hypothetical protein [Streptomyces sp. HUAS TT7]|uniref:hypothetical protein n=1 Tax=Streptomyces sp. HUAS TT7 TaxID=3447507 RepID=UPI003F65F9E7
MTGMQNALLWGIVLFQLLLSQRYIHHRMASNLGRVAAEHLATWPVRLIIIAGFAVVGAIALGVFDKIQWKWLSTAGAITYPLYLIHMFIGMTLIHHFRNRLPAPVLVVSGTRAGEGGRVKGKSRPTYDAGGQSGLS